MKLRTKLYNAARRARRWAEKNWQLYHCTEDMCGLCGVAAVQLWQELKKDGIRATIACHDYHAFVLYKEYIIDVTATQFNLPKVLIRKRNRFDREDYEHTHTFRSAKRFIEHQQLSGWPEDQIYGGIKR
jgi:hypothetical protein